MSGHEHDHAAAANATIDPVCGMSVSPNSTHHAMHEGQHFAFCSASCRTKFVAEPKRYAQAKADGAATEGAACP